MPRKRPPPPLTLLPPEVSPPILALRPDGLATTGLAATGLALGGTAGVRLVLEAADAAAVEAAAAALKARFGARFAVTSRRRGASGMRVTGSLQISVDEALDAQAGRLAEG